MAKATGGLADVRTVRRGQGATIDLPAHDGELVFGFVLDGAAMLDFRGQHPLQAADAFAIPPGKSWRLAELSPGLRMLHVTTARLD